MAYWIPCFENKRTLDFCQLIDLMIVFSPKHSLWPLISQMSQCSFLSFMLLGVVIGVECSCARGFCCVLGRNGVISPDVTMSCDIALGSNGSEFPCTQQQLGEKNPSCICECPEGTHYHHLVAQEAMTPHGCLQKWQRCLQSKCSLK